MAEPDVDPTGEGRDPRAPRDKVADGIRQGLGMLAALRDALEETIAEARERGDLTPDRARDAMRAAVAKAQGAAGEARERLDFVSQKEFNLLRERVDELRVRLDHLERREPEGPAGDASG